MIKLSKSNVVFDEEQHKYWYNGVEISGITKMINDYVFGGKLYDGVPEDKLEQAREKGKAVHSEIQMAIEGFAPESPSDEFIAFSEWKKANKVKFIRSEYLVDAADIYGVASPIDLVDREFCLYDIKRNEKLKNEYLRWQLSIYKYMFERMNSSLKVPHLYAIQLYKNKCNVVEIEPIADVYIEQLLEAHKNNEPWANPLHNIEDEEDMAWELAGIEREIEALDVQKKPLLERKAMIEARITQQMVERGILKHENDYWSLTRTPESKRIGIDTEALKKEKPAIFNKYKKETTVKGRLTVTFHHKDD